MTVKTEDNASLEHLIVRAIQDFQHRYPARALSWDFFQQHIPANVNWLGVPVFVAEDPANQPSLEEWKRAGKRLMTGAYVRACEYDPDMTAEQAYAFWAKSPVYADPLWDGIIIDRILKRARKSGRPCAGQHQGEQCPSDEEKR